MCEWKNIYLVYAVLLNIANADIDYLDSALLSKKLECADADLQLICQAICGNRSTLCIDDYCYCISIEEPEVVGASNIYNPGSIPRNMSCNSYWQQYNCQKNCGPKAALCVGEDCYCITFTPQENEKRKEKVRPKTVIHDYSLDDQDENNSGYGEDASEEIISSLHALRPTLRHHIAHFCPNLNIARECIRKCIAVGKPAFCGKDHVCYCGHKYEHSVDKPGDSKKLYAEFKDMYDKYFGTGSYKDTVELE